MNNVRIGRRSRYSIMVEPNLINHSNKVHEPKFNQDVITCDEPDNLSLN